MKAKLAAILLLASLVACLGEDTTLGLPPVTVSITPATRQVLVGDSADFIVTVVPAQPGASLTCTSSDITIAPVRSVGSVCRASAVKTGQVAVTAAIGTASVSAALIVTPPASSLR